MFNNLRPAALLILLFVFLVACSDNDDDDSPLFIESSRATYDFAAVDKRFNKFLDDNDVFDGISVTLVDQQDGTIHEVAFGDHELDTVVLLASASKMPATLLLMALNDDASLNFKVTATINNYLPWDGVYGDATTEQLLSNTAGIPGLEALDKYGAHLCQYSDTTQLAACAETIYTTETPGSVDPGTAFSYGGSQWQLAGAVAETAGGAGWQQLFDQYIGEPCGLELFRYGNPWSDLQKWTGQPDSLIGLENPNVEGGAISNLRDYAKLLKLVLDEGSCGDTRVLSSESIDFMFVDRGGPLGTPYGMSWWLSTPADATATTLFYDPGLFGSIAWVDTRRRYGGYVAIDDYSQTDSGAPVALVLTEIIPLIETAIDAARAE